LDPELLGTRIRLARERLGLSQGDLAALVSRDQRAISEYENGKRKLAATDLVMFARVLNVPLLFFFEGALSEEDLDREALSEFNRIPTFEGKQAAIQIVRVFADAMQTHA
jgi:transcriptional regulator with XRE-family HTH domain